MIFGMNKVAARGLGLTLSASLLIAILHAPVAFAAVEDTGCPSCPDTKDNNFSISVENLDREEASREKIRALVNRDVHLLAVELIGEGYTIDVENMQARKMGVLNDGETNWSTFVDIPYEYYWNPNGGTTARITYVDNGDSRRAYATVIGRANQLHEPLGMLRDNELYQRIVENLEGRGYEVKGENARVVKNYTPSDYASVPGCIEGDIWHTAVVSVEAVKGGQVKSIVAFVCIDKGKVLSIVDFGFNCVTICNGICDIGAGVIAGLGNCVGWCSGATAFLGTPHCIALCGAVIFVGCGIGCDRICDHI